MTEAAKHTPTKTLTLDERLAASADVAHYAGQFGFERTFVSAREQIESQALLIESLTKALTGIVDFCDDPLGSEKPHSLALGLAGLLPAARTALASAQRAKEQ